MKKVDRLWIQAIEKGIDDRLVDVLAKLQVIKNATWVHFKSATHIKLLEAREAKAAKRSRRSAREEYVTYDRAPRVIKPTKAR